MSWGDCCVKANGSWEVIVLWRERRGVGFARRTNVYAHTLGHTFKTVAWASWYTQMPSGFKSPNTATELLLQPMLIVFAVSGSGLLLIPCGAVGCSAIKFLMASIPWKLRCGMCVCVCVCACVCVWLWGSACVKIRVEVAPASVRGPSLP